MAKFQTRKFLNSQKNDPLLMVWPNLTKPIIEKEIDLKTYTSSPSSYSDILREYSLYAGVYAYRGHKIGFDGKEKAVLLVMGLESQVDAYLDFVKNIITHIEGDLEIFRALRRIKAVKIKYYLMHGNEAASFFKYSLINESIKTIKKLLAARGIKYIGEIINNDKKLRSYLEGRGNGFKLIFKRLKPGYGESKRNDASI